MLSTSGWLSTFARTRTSAATIAISAVVCVMALATASSAMAEPKGIFEKFKECPTEVPGVTLCSVAKTLSGEFVIGKTRVPINQTITQQGGYLPTGNPENPREFFGIPAKNGESMSKTALNVPGGLLDIVKCEEIKGEGWFEKEVRNACKAIFENEYTGVTATTELVANEKNPVIFNEFALSREEGTALTLPIRVHLKNPLLGNSCYIGSESNPIELHLTTGETHPPAGVTPLHGKKGTPETLEENELPSLRLTNNTLVDNDFSVPGAEGCGELFGYTGFLDGLVDSKLGLPTKAGENVAVLNNELNAAGAKEVVESESF
jgi:hypothetical protein